MKEVKKNLTKRDIFDVCFLVFTFFLVLYGAKLGLEGIIFLVIGIIMLFFFIIDMLMKSKKKKVKRK